MSWGPRHSPSALVELLAPRCSQRCWDLSRGGSHVRVVDAAAKVWAKSLAKGCDALIAPDESLTFLLGARSGRIVFTRFRLLITSVLRDIGRGRPCSFRKSPHALQSTEPNSSRRHNGVVDVPQFWQTGCVDPLVAIMMPASAGR